MYTSPWASLDIPKCNILTYLFPPGSTPSEEPLWIDADSTSNSLSPAEMLLLIKRFAKGLDRLGVAEQQAVMVFTPNHLYVPLIYLAATGSKRFFTGANPGYTAHELAHQMRNVEAALVLVHPTLVETATAAAEQVGFPLDRLYAFSADVSSRASHRGPQDWRSILASAEESASWHWDPLEGDLATQTVAVINFSSGTTGLPKGVCISHHSLVANSAQAIFNTYQATSASPNDKGQERWLAFLPLYHAYSQLFTINIACKLLIPVYIMPKFSFDDFARHIEHFRITSIQAVPPVLVMMTKRPEASRYDMSSVRYIVCGAAPLSSDLQNEVMNRFNLVVSQAFGMSETTCAAFMTPGMTKDLTGSIGHLLPNTDACLMDEDGKEIIDEGVPGELCLRGPQMMLRYWRNEKATQETITSQGWMKTGDVAVTRGGKWWIVDRKKELIKVNGLQVAPAELEAVLLENDAIADAAVTGVTVHGEELPRAYVVLQNSARGTTTTRDVQDFVAQKVSKHKRLVGGVAFVDEVPKLASGKIVRKTLKAWAKEDAKKLEQTVKARL